MKDYNSCIIMSIICRLLAFIGVLAFVAFIVAFTNSLHCLWLLFLLLAVEYVPVYEFKRQVSDEDLENKGENTND